jgi:hypothetical protein
LTAADPITEDGCGGRSLFHCEGPTTVERSRLRFTARQRTAVWEEKAHVKALLGLTGARLAVVGSVLAVGATVVLAQEKDLSMGNVNPPKHGTSQASQQFIDKLGELTQGKTKVAHHHSGALGGEREVAQQIQLGAVDFGPITTAPLSTLIPEMSVFQLPYIFRDYDHVFGALDGVYHLPYYEAVLDRRACFLS